MRTETQKGKKSSETAKKETPNPVNPKREQREQWRKGLTAEGAAHSLEHGENLSFRAENQTHLSEAEE